MSDTDSTSELPPVPPPSEPTWAKPSVSVIGLAIFAIGYGIAWITHDATVQTMYAGAAIAMGQQVIGFWLGSSAGSAKKDAMIAAAVGPKAPPPPPSSLPLRQGSIS